MTTIKNICITFFSAVCITTSALSLPATHAYLSVPELQELVKSSWNYEVKKYYTLLNQAYNQELLYEKTHHVFYHAQKSELRIVQDFVKNLYTFLHPHIAIKDFYFLRAWYDFPKTIDANTFIDMQEGGIPQEWNDNAYELSKQMLSVNFSLFGSTKNYGKFGECTFKYFFSNKSIKAPNVEAILEIIFDDFRFDKKYMTRLLKLNAMIETVEGSLFQIFVPVEYVDQIAFAAQRLGTPYRNSELMSNLFDKEKERYPALNPILDAYRNNPQQFGMTLDRLQGRLLFSQDVLLSPLSGVIIFRYTTIDPYKLKKYETKLKKLTDKIFNAWLKNLPTTSIVFDLFSKKEINILQKYYGNDNEIYLEV